jgi:hypothetical protein
MAIDCRTAGKDLARQLAWSGRGDAESFVDARAQVLASAEFGPNMISCADANVERTSVVSFASTRG